MIGAKRFLRQHIGWWCQRAFDDAEYRDALFIGFRFFGIRAEVVISDY